MVAWVTNLAFNRPYPGALSEFASSTNILSTTVASVTRVPTLLRTAAVAWKVCDGMPGI